MWAKVHEAPQHAILAAAEVVISSGSLSLSSLEQAFFDYLSEADGRPVSRQELLTQVWGYAPGLQTRTVSTTARRLRKKLADAPGAPQLLNVRGQGYVLQRPEPAPRPPRPSVLAAMEPPDRFIGRQAELDALNEARARGARWTTVLGTAGAGKTRLLTRWARQVVVQRPGRLHVGRLELARTMAETRAAVATCLGLGPEAGTERVLHTLVDRPSVVVLDNLEQLSEEVVSWLDELVARTPSVMWVASSRRVLGIRGERLLHLGGLSPGHARELFVERVGARGRVPDANDHSAIDRVLHTLDGLPLAIELAASRAAWLPMPELAARLERSLTILDASQERAQAGPAGRGRSLLAAIRWSWELLSDQQRDDLASLGVFAGGAPLEGVEAVLGDAALDRVQALAEHSLVRIVGGRVALLPTVRAFLEEVDPERTRHRARHAEWVSTQAIAHAEVHEHEPEAGRWLRKERDNVVAAFRTWLEWRDPRWLPLAGTLWYAFNGTDRAPCLALLLQSRAVMQPSGAASDDLRLMIARVAQNCGDHRLAQAELDAVVLTSTTRGQVEAARARLALKTGDRAAVRSHVMAAIEAQGKPDARLLYLAAYASRGVESTVQLERALALAEPGARWTAVSWGALARRLGAAGDAEGANRCIERALRIADRFGDSYLRGIALSDQASVLMSRGDLWGAREAHARRFSDWTEGNGARPRVSEFANAGFAHFVTDDFEGASELFGEAFRGLRLDGVRGTPAWLAGCYAAAAAALAGDIGLARVRARQAREIEGAISQPRRLQGEILLGLVEATPPDRADAVLTMIARARGVLDQPVDHIALDHLERWVQSRR